MVDYRELIQNGFSYRSFNDKAATLRGSGAASDEISSETTEKTWKYSFISLSS